MNIAVITGASSGLGKCYVEALCTAQFNLDEIWLIARRKERLEEIAAQHSQVNFRILSLDLVKEDDLEYYKNELARTKANVKLLINNAGFGKLGNFDEMSTQHSADMVNLNCRALTVITSLTLPFMSAGAAIINVCSIAAFTPNARMAVYCSTKAYVFSFSKALRFELKKRKINVTAVCPGPMDTEFLALADIEPGRSKTFDTLPRVNPKTTAKQSVKKALNGKAVYTPRGFYKFYRVLSKLIPHNIMMIFSKT